jgi:hypothetical protein
MIRIYGTDSQSTQGLHLLAITEATGTYYLSSRHIDGCFCSIPIPGGNFWV